ncbi:putative phospholipid-transporting ATPase 8 [Sarracenia purpurea var. burkii]
MLFVSWVSRKMPGDRRRGIHFSKLYSFSCLGSSFRDEHSQIGKKGYSRVVYCNDPDNPEAVHLNYRGNYVSTSKYTVANFIPKALFEQFRRVANIYFLIVACVSFSPLAPYSAISVLAPLVTVIGATMVKEAVEDWRRRKQDIQANNQKVEVYDNRSGTFIETQWNKLRVGDLVKVYKDEFFPADLLLVTSSYEDGICYVETMNLDGETNLKLKKSLDVTAHLHDWGKIAIPNVNKESGEISSVMGSRNGLINLVMGSLASVKNHCVSRQSSWMRLVFVLFYCNGLVFR